MEKQQRDILFDAIRKLVRKQNCPQWVVIELSNAVKKAKSITSNTDHSVESTETIHKRPEVGDVVKSNIKNDTCLYELIELSDVVQNVNLFTVKIVKGSKGNPEGAIAHNVPETMMEVVKC